MLYAREIIDLMAAFPGRPFRMIEIVRHIQKGRPHTEKEWERVRKSVRAALATMEETGAVSVVKPDKWGQASLYVWNKPGSQVSANRDENRENTCREVAPAGYDNPGYHSVSIAMQQYSAHMRRAN
ncbi:MULTISPECIES: hypothetical protein [Achromobacter]|uniref:hypothetical protein n=1 Tax=Achromobacter TaxID=222 RepID=UPI0014699441|nr:MULTISPECIES: hypothetical protein [Achromobacter]CAB3909225.1 hypothetical protein LMG26842_05776 [Achromobacter dolens]